MDQQSKGKMVLKATLESGDENSKECFGEFFCMAIEEKREEDIKRAFEEFYVESMCMAKMNQWLREQLETIKIEKKALEEMLKCKEMKLTHVKAIEEEFQDQIN